MSDTGPAPQQESTDSSPSNPPRNPLLPREAQVWIQTYLAEAKRVLGPSFTTEIYILEIRGSAPELIAILGFISELRKEH